MGFFGGDKPRVTKQEFHQKVRQSLYEKGFSHKELDDLEMHFGGDMHESESSHTGIDATEIEHGIGRLRDNMRLHTFSEKQIGEIDEEMKKHL